MAINLKPVSQLARKHGVKMIGYGGPGCGKTPVVLTAPNPVLLATEPGFMSIRNSNIPCWQANSYKEIKEFYDWILSSREARQFQTFCVDSVSQMAEIVLAEEQKKNRDGRKAYGEMSEKVHEILNGLYFLEGPHIYLIAKQDDKPDDGSGKKRPYFPGKELHVKVPHLYDLIVHVEPVTLQDGSSARAFRTADSPFAVARDRSGKLAELEPANLTYIFDKMKG